MTDNNVGTQMYMPVAPAYGGGNGNGFGDFGSGWWLIILLLCLGGGWGNGFGGFGGGGMFPWMMAGQGNTNNDVQRGFDQSAIMTGLTGIQGAVTGGFGDVQTALCGGFAGVNASINGAQNAIAQQMYANTIADMERSYGVQSQLAQCLKKIVQKAKDIFSFTTFETVGTCTA